MVKQIGPRGVIRRAWLTRVAGATGLMLMVTLATAAGYPEHPVRFVVPYAPGGPADLIARTVAERLSTRLGQPFVVDNRPGASGAIGAEAVAKAKPDGYTLLLSNIGDTVTVALGTRTPYDFTHDLQPVSTLALTPFVLAVGAQSTMKTVADLIALAKAKPDTVNFGSAGTGSASQLAGELFKSQAGIHAAHLPYKGQAPATADLIGGQLTFMFGNPVTILPQIRSGSLRALAVSGRHRFAALPDVPTVAESGLPDYDVTAWFGAMTTRGTPDEIVMTLNREIQTVLAEAQVRAKFDTLGVEPAGDSPDDFTRRIASEITRWSAVVKAANIRVD